MVQEAPQDRSAGHRPALLRMPAPHTCSDTLGIRRELQESKARTTQYPAERATYEKSHTKGFLMRLPSVTYVLSSTCDIMCHSSISTVERGHQMCLPTHPQNWGCSSSAIIRPSGTLASHSCTKHVDTRVPAAPERAPQIHSTATTRQHAHLATAQEYAA